jgi:hypothetical protein
VLRRARQDRRSINTTGLRLYQPRQNFVSRILRRSAPRQGNDSAQPGSVLPGIVAITKKVPHGGASSVPSLRYYLAPGVVVDDTPGVPTPCALGGVIEPWMLVVEPLVEPGAAVEPDMPVVELPAPVVPVLAEPAPTEPAEEPPAPPLVWAKAIDDVTARAEAKAMVANFMSFSSLVSREKPRRGSFVPDPVDRRRHETVRRPTSLKPVRPTSRRP